MLIESLSGNIGKIIEWSDNKLDSGYEGEIWVGRHMTVLTPEYHKKIPPKAAQIHLSRNLSILGPNDSLLHYIKSFRSSTLSSFQQLAKMCRDNDYRLADVDTFYGISPLANFYAAKFGFTLNEIPMFQRILFTRRYKKFISNHVTENKYWKNYRRKFGVPQKATITRDTLIDVFKPS